MNDPFEKKVRAAATAGWWVVLIGYVLLTVTWLVYLALVNTRPAWLLAMWGQDVGWDFMQVVSLWFLGVWKLFLWFMILAVLWLTLWARQLRKADQAMTEQEWLICTDLWAMLEFLRKRASDRKLRLLAVQSCHRIWNLLVDQRSRHAVLVAERYADGLADEADLANARVQAKDALTTVRAMQSQRQSEFYDPLDAAADAALATTAIAAFHPADLDLSIPRYDYFTSGIGGPGNALAAKRLREAEACGPRTPNADAVRLDQEGGAEQIWQETRTNEWRFQAHLLHCVFGPVLFRPISVDSAWLTWNGGAVPTIAQTIYDERAFDRLPILADGLEQAGCANTDILAHCRGPGPHVRGCWVVDLLLGKS